MSNQQGSTNTHGHQSHLDYPSSILWFEPAFPPNADVTQFQFSTSEHALRAIREIKAPSDVLIVAGALINWASLIADSANTTGRTMNFIFDELATRIKAYAMTVW